MPGLYQRLIPAADIVYIKVDFIAVFKTMHFLGHLKFPSLMNYLKQTELHFLKL